MYSQGPSMEAHYATAHEMALPQDEELYILEKELERRRKRLLSATERSRRKRRRKQFACPTTEEIALAPATTAIVVKAPERQERIDSLLSCVRLDLTGGSRSGVVGLAKSHRWWTDAIRNNVLGPVETGDDAVPELRALANSLPPQEISRVSELSVMSSDDDGDDEVTQREQRATDKGFLRNLQKARQTVHPKHSDLPSKSVVLQQVSPEARQVYDFYRLDKPARRYMKGFLQDARRDDEYLWITYLAVVERLKAAENFYCKGVSTPPPTTEQQRGDGIQNTHMLDRLWVLFSTLHPTQSIPPAAAYFISQYCLYRYINSINMRLFNSYRRLGAWDLQEAFLNFELPAKSDIKTNSSYELPIRSAVHDVLGGIQVSDTADSRNRITLARNKLLMTLFTPGSRYRPWWATELLRDCLTDNEARDVWSYWNRLGHTVLSKRLVVTHGGEGAKIIEHWDILSRRRYSFARTRAAQCLGSLRWWKMANSTCEIMAPLTHLQAAWDSSTTESIPLCTVGLTPAAAMGITEAIAAGVVEVGLHWTGTKMTDGANQHFPAESDPYEGFLENELLPEQDHATDNLTSLFSDIAFKGLAPPDSAAAETPGTASLATLPMEEPLPEEEDDSESDDDESEHDEADLDLEGEKKGGVQKHLLVLTADAPDLDSVHWRFGKASPLRCCNQNTDLPRTRLLYWETGLHTGLAGVGDNILDYSPIDPLLIPLSSHLLSAFATPDGWHGHLRNEEWLTFEEDHTNCWTAAERHKRSQELLVSPEPLAIKDVGAEPSAEPTPTPKRRRTKTIAASQLAVNQIVAIEDPEPDLVRTVPGNRLNVCDLDLFIGLVCQLVDPVSATKLKALWDRNTLSFVAALLRAHYLILASSPLGVYRLDLIDTLMQIKGSQLSFTRELLDGAVQVLVVLRVAVKIPAVSDWKLLSPQCAVPYMVPIKAISRLDAHGRRITEREFISDLNSAGLPESIDEAVMAELFSSGKLTDSVTRSPYVPERIWREFGPPPGSLKKIIGLYPNQLLSLPEKQILASLLADDLSAFGVLRRLQGHFADLRAFCSSDEVGNENGILGNVQKWLFDSTDFLNESHVPPTLWTRMDGRLNDSLVALLVSRLGGDGGATVDCGGVSTAGFASEKSGLIDRCLLEYILEILSEEKLVVKYSQPEPQAEQIPGLDREVVIGAEQSGVTVTLDSEIKLTGEVRTYAPDITAFFRGLVVAAPPGPYGIRIL